MTRARFYTSALLISIAGALLIAALPAVVPPLVSATGPRGAGYDADAARRRDLEGLDAEAFEAAWALVLYLEVVRAAVTESGGAVRLGEIRDATDASGAPVRSGVVFELDAPSSMYPPAMYCAQCEDQGCFFEDDGFQMLASLVAPDRVRELAVRARGAGVSLDVTFIGGADTGKIAPTRREPTCRDGRREAGRRGGSYRVYTGECGRESLECVTDRSGGVASLASGVPIDTNPLLACVRARCLYAASELYRADDFAVDLELRADVVLGTDRSSRTSRVQVALVLPEASVPGASLRERLTRVLARRSGGGVLARRAGARFVARPSRARG